MAVGKLTEIREQLAGWELADVERGVVLEVAIPAIERAIAALSLDPGIVRDWLRLSEDLERGSAVLRAARKALGYASNLAAVAGAIEFITEAESIIHRIIA